MEGIQPAESEDTKQQPEKEQEKVHDKKKQKKMKKKKERKRRRQEEDEEEKGAMTNDNDDGDGGKEEDDKEDTRNNPSTANAHDEEDGHHRQEQDKMRSLRKEQKVKKEKKKKDVKQKKKKKKQDSNNENSDEDDGDSNKEDSMDDGDDDHGNDGTGGDNGLSPREEEKRQLLNAQHSAESQALTGVAKHGRIVASSAIEFYDEQIKELKKKASRAQELNNITLLLFYQYVEPVWDESTYNFMLKTLQEMGTKLELTGRMRVAREGLNCTLTGTHEAIVEYCTTLRKLRPKEFNTTEFKLTNDLPLAQKFPNLKVFKVVELVHYGLEGPKAPPIAKFQGTHLEPKDYHQKLAEPNTIIVDVRNHYEAVVGRFVPPTTTNDTGDAPPPQWLDPKMRKSTEFPVWLDKPETKELMKGKQVLMYRQEESVVNEPRPCSNTKWKRIPKLKAWVFRVSINCRVGSTNTLRNFRWRILEG